MYYEVLLEESPYGRQPRHMYVYRGPDKEIATRMARSMTAPHLDARADVIEVAEESDGLGWVGQRRLELPR